MSLASPETRVSLDVVPGVEKIFFKNNEYFYKAGMPANFVVIILEGIALKTKSKPSGETVGLALVNGPSLLGDETIAGERRFGTSAKALGPCTAQFLDRSEFFTHANSNPGFADATIEVMSGRVRAMHSRIPEQAYLESSVRLARALQLFSTYSINFQWITKVDLAQITGMTREQLFSLLKDFRSEGIVAEANGERQIEILSQELLKARSIAPKRESNPNSNNLPNHNHN